MQKRFFAAVLMVASMQAVAADKAIASFTLGYAIGDKGYLDTLLVTKNEGNNEYTGITTTGRQIWGVKSGDMLCMSSVDRPLYGETWCFPYKVKRAFAATYTMTYCDGSGIYEKCTGFPNQAAVERKKLASSASSQAEPADDSADQEKLTDAMVARGRH